MAETQEIGPSVAVRLLILIGASVFNLQDCLMARICMCMYVHARIDMYAERQTDRQTGTELGRQINNAMTEV